MLKSATREISTLSPTLRSAWDSRPLQLLTRTAPARATSGHIVLIGHITQAELRHHTNTIELANGFMNRLILIACRRTRLLPEGGNPEPLAGTGLDRLLAGTLQHARQGASYASTNTPALCGGAHTPASLNPTMTGSPARSAPAPRLGWALATASFSASSRSQDLNGRAASIAGLARGARHLPPRIQRGARPSCARSRGAETRSRGARAEAPVLPRQFAA